MRILIFVTAIKEKQSQRKQEKEIRSKKGRKTGKQEDSKTKTLLNPKLTPDKSMVRCMEWPQATWSEATPRKPDPAHPH